MDIYQIWTTYNPMWSEREIICFSVLMILVMVVVAYGIWKDEYSCAVTPQVRQTGNRLSGLAGTAYANLLA